jgi:hypothetical protein
LISAQRDKTGAYASQIFVDMGGNQLMLHNGPVRCTGWAGVGLVRKRSQHERGDMRDRLHNGPCGRGLGRRTGAAGARALDGWKPQEQHSPRLSPAKLEGV